MWNVCEIYLFIFSLLIIYDFEKSILLSKYYGFKKSIGLVTNDEKKTNQTYEKPFWSLKNHPKPIEKQQMARKPL